jgi:hypothetical protein
MPALERQEIGFLEQRAINDHSGGKSVDRELPSAVKSGADSQFFWVSPTAPKAISPSYQTLSAIFTGPYDLGQVS